MGKIALNLLFTVLLMSAFCFCVNAQDTNQNRPENKMDLPIGLKETLTKQRIAQEQKEYQELVDRGEEAAKLGEELDKSFESNEKLSTEDVKKLDRLEKLVKKIRDELGAKDDDSDKKEFQGGGDPLSLKTVLSNIKEDTANLLSEIKKVGRFSISVVAVESSNAVLKLVRFLRFNKD